MWRKLHRWLSFASLFFILWVSITGILLALDTTFPAPGVGDRPPDPTATGWWNDRTVRSGLHFFLQDLHRGDKYLGLPGHYLGFLTGLSLSFLSISGIQMYLQMLKRRRANGYRQLFWSTGTGMRRYHRWISTAGMLLLVYVAISGSLTSLVQLIYPQYIAHAGPSTAAVPAPEQSTLATPGPQAEANASVQPEALSGPAPAPAAESERKKNISAIMQEWHNGSIVGWWGRWVVILTGISFVFLAVSGFVVYLQMWKLRRKHGQKQLFWK